MNPVISVVITTYNRKKIVREALKSVFIQKPANYEVVVVDDGSTDGTVEYLKSLNLPIYIVEGNHKGIAASRNRGIKKAKGQYIAFLDSDDLWIQGILKAQLSYLKQHPTIPLVYTDQYIESSGKRIRQTRFQSVNLSHKEKIKFSLSGFVQFVPIHISSVMIRKSIFDEVGHFDERLKIHDDTEMWNRISEKHNLGYIEKPLSIRRCGRDSEHITKEGHRNLYCTDGRRYLQIYEQRRKSVLTREEKDAIQESYRRIDQIQGSAIPLHFHLREFK